MIMNTVTNYCEEVKYNNPDKFAHILPITGSFQTKMSFMSAIYKRLKESSIEDLLVQADLITPRFICSSLMWWSL